MWIFTSTLNRFAPTSRYAKRTSLSTPKELKHALPAKLLFNLRYFRKCESG